MQIQFLPKNPNILEHHFCCCCNTNKLARKAVLKAKISYKTLKPIITIKALKKSCFKRENNKKREALKAIENSVYRLKGNFMTGREHFALEGHSAFVIPQEDNDFKVFSSTQHPSETQQIIAKCLIKKVIPSLLKLGGWRWPGGTETTFIFAAPYIVSKN